MARRVPPTRFPNSVAVGYARALKRQVSDMGRETLAVFDNQIKEEIKTLKRSDAAEERADGPLGIIQSALAVITNVANQIYDVYISTQIATDHIKLIDKSNLKNMEAQGKVVGVNPISNNDRLAEFIEASIQENVSYIKNIKDDYLTEIERIVLQGAKKGSSVKDIRDQIVRQTGMAKSRAEFIAIDQTGTIYGQLTAERHQNMGVKDFIWRTSDDERVRVSHERLDDSKFSYNDPPTAGKRQVLPGEDYRCRCVAEPVFE